MRKSSIVTVGKFAKAWGFGIDAGIQMQWTNGSLESPAGILPPHSMPGHSVLPIKKKKHYISPIMKYLLNQRR